MDEELEYSEDGVDLTLIRSMLSLKPAQRLEALEQFVDDILRMRAQFQPSASAADSAGSAITELTSSSSAECAAFSHGAPITTFDLDIVHSRDSANIDHLLIALEELDAHYRGRDLKPGRSHLESRGHQLLDTRFAPLDILGEIGEGRGYDALLPHTVQSRAADGITIRMLDMETLILTKADAGRDKDKAVLLILRRVLEEQRRQQPRPE